ncbi:PaaI family thioesterase [Pseudoduganella buxea]|uniref:Thioesterase n=2 Tax=Pseudoduganella buxea TaxID=1949069 RepID=A0ABQ1KQ86_9BURK|nr:PaaI family thioesterase [Pseudoduganella buxea]GGC06716.1 thioesterase [Pseudoduganella buxea]
MTEDGAEMREEVRGKMLDDVPPGFERIKRGGPFVAGLGELYYRRNGADIVIALRVTQRHTNMRGIAHGGLLASLADTALGIGLTLWCDGKQSFVTVSLTTDFLAAARPGDWVEAHVQVERIGGRVAFAGCHLEAGGKRLLRATGVFAVMAPLTAEQLAAGY